MLLLLREITMDYYALSYSHLTLINGHPEFVYKWVKISSEQIRPDIVISISPPEDLPAGKHELGLLGGIKPTVLISMGGSLRRVISEPKEPVDGTAD
jgi:hypothetical protein